jgi:hypothetical protein
LVFSFGTLFSLPLIQDDVPCVLLMRGGASRSKCWRPSIGFLRGSSGVEEGPIS